MDCTKTCKADWYNLTVLLLCFTLPITHKEIQIQIQHKIRTEP